MPVAAVDVDVLYVDTGGLGRASAAPPGAIPAILAAIPRPNLRDRALFGLLAATARAGAGSR